jgi:ClpP class serine protease
MKLEQFVAANPQNLENHLKPLRKERIRRLQDIRQSQLIVYYSLQPLNRRDAELFYEVLTTLRDVRNLELFLLSPGGFADSAFKMARLCQRIVGEGRFSVLIPYYAKSAATILALGADELVMGAPSELGPID